MTALLDRPATDDPVVGAVRRTAPTPAKRRPGPGSRPGGDPGRPVPGRPSPGRPAGRRPLPVEHRVVLSAPATLPVRRPARPARPVAQPAPHRPTVAPRPSRTWLGRTWQWRSFLAAATLLTLGMHLWRLSSSYDLFIDEPFYTQVGQSIARGGMPYGTGSPFFLHPPGFFVVEAGWMRVFGGHSDVFAAVLSIRKLVAVVAALTSLVLGLLVSKVAGRVVATAVVLAYMINAFANDQSSLVILEPITLFWTISGYAVLAHLDPRDGDRRYRQIRWAGLLFGIACLSKEFAVFVTLVPLAIAFVTGTWLTRREALRAARITCIPWAGWLIVVWATGDWKQFVAQITSGYERTTGKTQISGFNAKNAPSFLDTLIGNLDQLWTAYAVLGLGTIAICYVAWTSKTDPRLRFLSFFGLGAVPLLAYCVLLGTNEEQFFNFLFFPALICLVIAVRTNWWRFRGRLRAAVLVLLIAAAVSDGVQYLDLHLGSDDGTYLVDQWMAQHVPDGTVVSTTNPVQREIFLRYTMVDDKSNSTLNKRVKYLVVFDKQVDQGYAFVDRATVDKQVRGQRVVFSTTDDSNGRMVVYAIS